MMITTSGHEELLSELEKLVLPWRKLTIAVDGITGSGKSCLSRYLAWQLDIPAIDTDMFRIRSDEQPSYRYSELENLIQARHEMNRPVILEGIFMCHTLEQLGIEADFLIYVENSEANCGLALKESLPRYLTKYRPKKIAQNVFSTDFKNM